MEAFLVLILLIFAIYNFFTIKSLKEKIRILEIELKQYYRQFHELYHPKIPVKPNIQQQEIPIPKSEIKPQEIIEKPQVDIIAEPIIESVQEKPKETIIEETTETKIDNLMAEEKIKQQTKKIFDRLEEPKHRTIQEFENLIGGRILNRIGSAALIIGIALFLKYAFDNNLISESMRIVIGFVTGAGLLILGERYIKKDFQIFAQGLFGTGLATLYLTVFAAYNFYHLFSQPVSFLVMTLVTALCYYLARRHNSKSISWIASIGGYFTPILLQTGHTNVLALMGFLALLNINQILQIKYKQEWQQLIIVSFIMTYFYFFSLIPGFTGNEFYYVHGIIFLFVNYILFYFYEHQYKNITNTFLGIANQILMNLGFLLIFIEKIDHFSTLIIWNYLACILIINISQIIFIPKKFKWQSGFIISFILSWFHLSIIISRTFEGFIRIAGFSHNDVIFLFVIWAFFYICELLFAKKYQNDIKNFILWISILNITFLYIGINLYFGINVKLYYSLFVWKPLVVLILSIIYFVPYLFKPLKNKISEDMQFVYLISSFTLLILATYLQFNDYYVPILWTIEIIIICMILYRNKNIDVLANFKLTIFLPLFYTLFYVYLPECQKEGYLFTPFLNPSFLVFSLLAISLFIANRLPDPDKNKKTFFGENQNNFKNFFEILWVVIFTIAFLNEINEIHNYIQRINLTYNWWYSDLFNFIRAGFLILTSYLLFIKNLFFNKSIKLGSIIVLSTISTFCTIIFLIAENHLFQPYINLRIAFVAFSLFIIIHQITLSEKEFSKTISTFFRILLTCLTFAFVTSEVRFYFASIGSYSQILQNQKELATSIAWIFLSLIFFVIGIWKRIRVYRFISIILFGISILKVFIFDLSFLETVYRIISFIVLGVILIFISFLYQKYKDVIFMDEK